MKTDARRASRSAPGTPTAAPKRFLRRPEVCKKVGLSASTIFNLEREDKFPKHVLLTPRCAVWDEAAVDAWMAERMAAPTVTAFVPVPPRALKRAAG